MPGRKSDEWIKQEFDRVLNRVQDVSRSAVSRFTGNTEDVLVEEINARESGYLTGRMSNNLMVHFKGEPDLIGKIIKVRLHECLGFYYMGEAL